MKKTKSILVKVMAFMLVFASLFNPISAENMSTITISEVTTGDKFNVYKVIDIEYDKETNTVDYYWLYSEDGEKLETPELIYKNIVEHDLRVRAIKMGTQLKENIEPTAVLTSNEKKLSYTGKAGGYLFIPFETGDVYDPMLGFIQYKKGDTGYELSEELIDAKIDAKKDEIRIEKVLLESDLVGENQIINFEIKFNVPKYPADAVEKKLQVAD